MGTRTWLECQRSCDTARSCTRQGTFQHSSKHSRATVSAHDIGFLGRVGGLIVRFLICCKYPLQLNKVTKRSAPAFS